MKTLSGNGLWRLSVAALLVAALPMGASAASTFDHSGVFGSSYTGADECMSCHAFISGAVDVEVANSAHYQLRTENENVAFPGGGSHGMIDRACALRGTNMLVTYDQNCGACHIGIDLPFPDPQTGQPSDFHMANLDCLVCHATVYDMDNDGVAEPLEDAGHRARTFNAALGRDVWHQDHMVSTAGTVGGRVGRDACLRCHDHGQGDYYFKRGTPFTPETDVHAARGFRCTSCHVVSDHQIARGSRVSDMHAWERQDVEVTCTNCHSTAPHNEWTAYNLHTTGELGRMACETCHISYTSGVARRVWTSTYGVQSGPESNVPTFNSDTGLYEYYEERTAERERPTYRWFTGGVSMLAEPMANPNSYDFQIPNRSTPDALIYPFRNIVNGMIMDRRGIAMDPEYSPDFTMLAAMEAQSPMMIAMGFMRPEGLNDAERAMLGMFPNLLMFDVATYYGTGNIAEAVSLAQGTMGAMFMGMDWRSIPRDQLIAMGSQAWSGQPTGLDLPDNPFDPNYINDMDPTTATGSFIQLSHSVTREGALRCVHCHSPEGVVDFNALLYSPSDQFSLSNLLAFKTHEEVLEYLLGQRELVGSQLIQADPNQDNVVDIADAVLLISVGR